MKSYDNIFILSSEGSGSMYLWRLINTYFVHNENKEFKKVDHNSFNFDRVKSIYHVSFPTGRPEKWLTYDMLPNTINKIIFIKRASIYSIYSNYNRFFSKEGKNENSVRNAINSYEKSLKHIDKFKKYIDFETITITYESLINDPYQTLNIVSEYLEFNYSWDSVINKIPPKNKNDFRFAKDSVFISSLKSIFK